MSLTIQEKKNVKEFLVSVYGPKVQTWEITSGIFDLTYDMLKKSKKCSDLMDLVPRPMPYGQSATRWLAKEVRKALIRQLKERKEHYTTCVKAVAYHMTTKFEMERNGI